MASATIAPDGQHAAYVLTVPRVPFEEEDGPNWDELHVAALDGTTRPFVTGSVNVGNLKWLPDEFEVHARRNVWEHWQFFLERSPIYHADQSRTPTLILHGTADPRVHPSQSLEFYRHLKLRGKAPVRLVW